MRHPVMCCTCGAAHSWRSDSMRRVSSARASPVHVAEGVLNIGAGGGRGAFSVSSTACSPTGAAARSATARLTWSRGDGVETPNGAGRSEDYRRVSLEPRWGPRGRRGGGAMRARPAICLLDLVQAARAARLTSDRFSIWPIWSADGASVIFPSMRDGCGRAWYRQLVNAGEDAQRLFRSTAPTTVTDLSADGDTFSTRQAITLNGEIGVFSVLAAGGDAAPVHPHTWPESAMVTCPGTADGWRTCPRVRSSSRAFPTARASGRSPRTEAVNLDGQRRV